jgi:hypothetical protein
LPDTGKSTIALIIGEVLNMDIKTGYAITRTSDFNSERKARRETKDDRLKTNGKVLIIIDEVKKDEKLDSETTKSDTGGASKNARGVFRADESLDPTALTINTCNYLPHMPWEDAAFVDRLILCEFATKIPNPDKTRPMFKEIAREEGSGILNLLLEADRNAQVNGPPPVPERFKKTVQSVAEGRDILGNYLKTYYSFGDPKVVDNRMQWKSLADGIDAYYTLGERYEKRFIPKRPAILEALKKFNVDITNDKTRVRGEPKPVRGVLLGMRPKTPQETEAEDVAAWLKDEDDTVEYIGKMIADTIKNLAGLTRSIDPDVLVAKIGVPKAVIDVVVKRMRSDHKIEYNEEGEIVLIYPKNS